MIMKAAATVMIIAASGIWGLSGARRLSERQEQLGDLKMALAYLDKEISYLHTNLSQALQNTAGFTRWPVNSLFATAAQELSRKKGITADEAWLQGIKALQAESQLCPKDMELLATLASQLGTSSAFEQNKTLTALGEELALLQLKARQETDSNHKLWSYGGFIIGTAIVLLLI